MRMLIVEDTEDNRAAAEEYFAGVANTEVLFAEDYESGVATLRQEGLDAVITDLFMPRRQGSDDRTLGQEVIERITPAEITYPATGLTEEDRKSVDGLVAAFTQLFEDNDVEITDDLRQRVQNYAVDEVKLDDGGRPEQDERYALLQEHGAEYAELAFESNEIPHWRPTPERRGRNPSRMVMESYLAESPSNQPLGVLVEKEAMALGLPCIMATSTYHHDEATNPVCWYRRGKELPEMVDVVCGYGGDNLRKDTPDFWEKAHDALLKVYP